MGRRKEEEFGEASMHLYGRKVLKRGWSKVPVPLVFSGPDCHPRRRVFTFSPETFELAGLQCCEKNCIAT